MDQSINDSKSCIWNSFFENNISGMKILYSSTCFSGHYHFFLISNFLTESLKVNKKYQKSLILQYSFAQKTSLILRTSTQLTLKIMYSCNTAKDFSHFAIYPANIFLSEKTFSLHHFLGPKKCILEGLWKEMSVYFCISL